MYIFNRIYRYAALMVVGLVLALPVSAQEQVRITSESAGIFIAPDSTQTLVTQAIEGEVFEPTGYEDGWLGIHMFSGEIRYVSEADVEPDYELITHHIDSSIKNEFCTDIRKSQKMAIENADTHISESWDRSAAINLLLDRYILEDLREYEVPAVNNSVVMGCMHDTLHPWLMQQP